MAELTTLARPYARAAFEFARDAQQLSAWSECLSLAAAVALQEKVKQKLEAPQLTSDEKSAVFVAVCGDALSTQVRNFIHILAENKRLELLPEIYPLFEAYKAQQEKAIDVEVTTAFELSPEIEAKLIKELSRKLNRDVTLQTTLDQSLLGGAVVRAGDTVIDGSVRGRLSQLAEVMGSH